jgi:hypothetical protein
MIAAGDSDDDDDDAKKQQQQFADWGRSLVCDSPIIHALVFSSQQQHADKLDASEKGRPQNLLHQPDHQQQLKQYQVEDGFFTADELRAEMGHLYTALCHPLAEEVDDGKQGKKVAAGISPRLAAAIESGALSRQLDTGVRHLRVQWKQPAAAAEQNALKSNRQFLDYYRQIESDHWIIIEYS